jgi:hypothetical protein
LDRLVILLKRKTKNMFLFSESVTWWNFRTDEEYNIGVIREADQSWKFSREVETARLIDVTAPDSDKKGHEMRVVVYDFWNV